MPYKFGLIKTLVHHTCKINNNGKTVKSNLAFIKKNVTKEYIPTNRNMSPSQTIKQPSPSTPVVMLANRQLQIIEKLSVQVKVKIKALRKMSSYFSIKDAISMYMTPYV